MMIEKEYKSSCYRLVYIIATNERNACHSYCQPVVRSTHHMCFKPPRIFLHEICFYFSFINSIYIHQQHSVQCTAHARMYTMWEMKEKHTRRKKKHNKIATRKPKKERKMHRFTEYMQAIDEESNRVNLTNRRARIMMQLTNRQMYFFSIVQCTINGRYFFFQCSSGRNAIMLHM